MGTITGVDLPTMRLAVVACLLAFGNCTSPPANCIWPFCWDSATVTPASCETWQMQSSGPYKKTQEATRCKGALMCQIVEKYKVSDPYFEDKSGQPMAGSTRLSMEYSSACDVAGACTGNMPSSKYSQLFTDENGDSVQGLNMDGNRIMGVNYTMDGCKLYRNNTKECIKDACYTERIKVYCVRSNVGLNGRIPMRFNTICNENKNTFTADTSINAAHRPHPFATLLSIMIAGFALLWN